MTALGRVLPVASGRTRPEADDGDRRQHQEIKEHDKR